LAGDTLFAAEKTAESLEGTRGSGWGEGGLKGFHRKGPQDFKEKEMLLVLEEAKGEKVETC